MDAIKKRNFIIALSVLGIFVATAIVGIIMYLNKKPKINMASGEFCLANLNNNIKPEGASLKNIDLPEDGTPEELAYALKLYRQAELNLKNDQKVAYFINTKANVLNVPTGGYRFYVKNNGKYFNTDYFFIEDTKDTPKVLKGIIKGAAKESTQYSLRSYYDASLNIGFEQKAKEVYLKDTEEELQVGTNWEDLYYTKSIEMPSIMAESPEKYSFSDFVINENTIKEYSVDYDAENGYFKIKFVLDCENKETMGDSLKYLIDGTQDSSAKYVSITQDIEIWNNGKFKKVLSYNEWYAPKAYKILEMNSANDYRTYFFYGDYETDINNYPYAVETIKEFNEQI